MIKRAPASIWDLLVWAYRGQRVAERQREGRLRPAGAGFGRDSVVRVMRAGELGFVSAGGAAASIEDRPPPPDALVVWRYVQALPAALRVAVERQARLGVEPERPAWPERPRLVPARWRQRRGILEPAAVWSRRLQRSSHVLLRIEPDPQPLLAAAAIYAPWWDGLALLRRVVAFEAWELQQWSLTDELPPRAPAAPAWATGWCDSLDNTAPPLTG